MVKIALTFLVLLLMHPKSDAQESCSKYVTYKTSHLGDGKTFLPIPLKFYFDGDTLRIADNRYGASATDNTPYYILGKECKWNKDKTEGESTYKLEVESNGEKKYPVLSIKVKEGVGIINLQYKDSEPRVFRMVL